MHEQTEPLPSWTISIWQFSQTFVAAQNFWRPCTNGHNTDRRGKALLGTLAGLGA